MSAIASIIAFDGAATPVSHTFAAGEISRKGEEIVAHYKETVSTVPDVAQGRVFIKKTRLNNGVQRLAIRVELPVMESISGTNASGYTAAPKVAFTDTAEFVYFAAERSTPASRKLTRQLLTNIVNGIATTVTPVSTGPSAELLDTLIMPT